MRKFLFFLLCFMFCSSISLAYVQDVQFVGGTGGSKIITLDINDNYVDTTGVIYDPEASLVYEVSYTNNSSNKKKLTDIKLPDTETVLNYDFSNIDFDKTIDVGETIKFQYSIKSDEGNTTEQLEKLNEVASAQLVFSSVLESPIGNPETIDTIIFLFVVCVFSAFLYKYTKSKKSFYFFLLLFY